MSGALEDNKRRDALDLHDAFNSNDDMLDLSQGGALLVKRLVIHRRRGNEISHSFELLRLRKDLCVNVLCIGVNLCIGRGLSLDSKAFFQQPRRTLVRLSDLYPMRRSLIRLESLPLSVWTFRIDDHGRYSPHKNGQPFCGRGEMMRTMVLEPVCVDVIEPPTFSFFPINTGAVISISDGLHASFRVANCFSNCTRKRSCPGRSIADACLFEKISLKRIATRRRSVSERA